MISSTRFAQISAKKKVNPVRFPPGRAMLVTSPDVDGVGHSGHHNWNGRGGLLGCSCAGRAMGYEHIDVEVHQFGCENGKAIVVSLGKLIVDGNIFSFFVAELA